MTIFNVPFRSFWGRGIQPQFGGRNQAGARVTQNGPSGNPKSSQKKVTPIEEGRVRHLVQRNTGLFFQWMKGMTREQVASLFQNWDGMVLRSPKSLWAFVHEKTGYEFYVDQAHGPFPNHVDVTVPGHQKVRIPYFA